CRPHGAVRVSLRPELAPEFIRRAQREQFSERSLQISGPLLQFSRSLLWGGHFSSALPRRAATWRPAARSLSTSGHNCREEVARRAAALPMRRVVMGAIWAISTKP